MSEWTPTRDGIYLLNGLPRFVEIDMIDRVPMPLTRVEADPHRGLSTVVMRRHMPTSGWSLLAPAWQDGEMTAEQIEQWPWWAVELRLPDHGLICAAWAGPDDSGSLQGGAGDVPVSAVRRSAPIQPDWSDGPRWVPLEVTK